MGVRQELVRVSVRAVDMLSSFLSPRGVGRLRIGPVAQHYVLARLAERIEWLGSRLRLAGDRARRLCFAWASRRLASSRRVRVWASSLLPLRRSRPGFAAFPVAGSRRAPPRRRLRYIAKPDTPIKRSCGAAASGRSRGTAGRNRCSHNDTRPSASDRNNRSTAAPRGAAPHGDRGRCSG